MTTARIRRTIRMAKRRSIRHRRDAASLADHLPGEAAEALLELATGGKPRVLQPAVATANPFEHPDAQRRFRVMANVEELERALDFPWEKWTVFLHPEQRQLVETRLLRTGTGFWLRRHREDDRRLASGRLFGAHNPDARVLLTTFSDTLAHALQTRLKRLLSNEPRLGERIDVYSLDAIGQRLYKSHIGQATLATRDVVVELLRGGIGGRGRPQIQPAFPAHGMGAASRCVATGKLGRLSRCCSPRSKDQAL